MAFLVPFDPTTPTDADPASEGDDRIREIKAGLIERLAQVINGWPDTDPLTLKRTALDEFDDPVQVGTLAGRPAASVEGRLYYASDQDKLYVSWDDGGSFEWMEVDHAPVRVGPLADRGATPARAGDAFFALDTGVLFVGDDALAWQVLKATVDTGDASARPAAGLRTGHLYLSQDTGRLSAWTGAVWRDLTPAAETAYKSYNGALAVASKAAVLSIVKVLYLKVTGVADGSGEFEVDFTELAGYDINNLQLVSGQEIKRTGVTTGTAGTISVEVNAGINQVILGDLGAGNTFEATLQLGFTA